MFTIENFSFKKFVDQVMEKMKLNEIPEDQKEKFRKQIVETLGDRIITSAVNGMNNENILQFEMIRSENPQFTTFETLFMMADNIPAIAQIIEKSINDLEEELTHDADKVNEIFSGNSL